MAGMYQMRKKLFVKILTWAITLIAPIVMSYYIVLWLNSKTLSYYTQDDIRFSKGTSSIGSINAIKLDINKVLYYDQEFDSLHIVRFIIIGDQLTYVEKGAQFVFSCGDSSPISPQNVIDISATIRNANSSYIKVEKSGVGLIFQSDIPKGAEINVTLVLNKIYNNKIIIQKAVRANEEFVEKTNPANSTISMSIYNFVTWIICSVLLYSIFWLMINIYTNSNSVGTKILNGIKNKIIGDRRH